MLTLDKIAKRMRSGVSETEFVHFNGTIKTSHPEEADERHAAIVCQDVWTTRNVSDKSALNALTRELERISAIRAHVPEGEDPSDTGLPIDRNYRYGIFRHIRFPVYTCANSVIAGPVSIEELKRLVDSICKAITAIHDAGYLVWNMSPVCILERRSENPKYMLSPYAIIALRPNAPEELRTMMEGCTIVSPYQILVDMMNSKYEREEIELSEFKIKMRDFWTMVLHRDFKHVPDVCQFYQSQKAGMTDYLDAIICKFCKTRKDKNGKTIVLKDPTDMLKPAMLKGVDWFAFGVVLDGYLELLINKDASFTPPDNIMQLIYECLSMTK